MKYTLRFLGFFVVLLLVLYLVVYIYVTSNKQKLISQVTAEISEKLNGEVSVGNVELSFFSHFPTIGVVLEKVSIKDSMFETHKHPFVEVDEAYIQLNLQRLISKQPPLSGLRLVNGNIYLYTDSTGYTNAYLFKQKKDPARVGASTDKNKNNELKTVRLEDVRITINDLQNEKLHDFTATNLKVDIDENKSLLIFKVEQDVLVNNLSFRVPTGSFVKGRPIRGTYEFSYDKNLKRLLFNDVSLSIGGQVFNFSKGRFDLEGATRMFNLRIRTNQILYPFAKTLLTAKILRALNRVNVTIDQPLDVEVQLAGKLRGGKGDPVINVLWSTKNTHLATPFFDFDNASFKGIYTNEVVKGLERRDPNSKIVVTNFTAKWQGLPVTSDSFAIINLAEPLLVCNLRSQMALSDLNNALKSSTINLNSGKTVINLAYKGPITRNKNTNSFINGFIGITNGSVTYVPRDVELTNVNCRIAIKSSDVFVENLETVVLNNKIVMQGAAKDLLTVVSSEPNKAVLDWNIYSPSLNLAAFAYLLKPQRARNVKATANNKLEEAANQIDEVIAQGSIKVKLKADKLYYKKFEGTNTIANLSLLNDRYILHQVALQHAGGSMNLSGSLLHTTNNYHQAKINVSLNNMNVSKVFEAFNNFGQDGITAENLRGKLTSDVNLQVAVNDEGTVYKESVEGVVDFSLKNGALIKYEPLKKMQVFVLKKRDFDNITFAELKDRLVIKNEEVKIDKLEIQSSVLTMFVDGIFSMKGNTDMRIQLPLSNLKKRGDDYVPENLADGKKAGASVYLRGTPGKDGNIKFKLDVFNKLRRDKVESE